MRIGLNLYGTLETKSGGTLYDRMVVAGLRRQGHEVTVLPLPSGSYLGRLRQGLAGDRLVNQVLGGRFDLLLQDELCHPSLFLVNRRITALGGPPLVAIVHHLLSDEPRGYWLNRLLAWPERRFLASVDGFICNSLTTRQRVEALVGCERPGVIAHPAGDRFPGPSPSRKAIAERASRPGPLQLLFVGALIPRKGLLPLLQALAGVERGHWRLSVVGDPEVAPAHVREAKGLADRLGLADSIRFLGPRPEAELAGIFASHHLFCMPYAFEGFGIALLEAMGFGLPAVGCRHGAAGETISHGVNGFLLDPGDRAGLIDLIHGLHHDRSRLAALSQAALETFTGRPGWREMAAAIEGFIRELAGQGHHPRQDGAARAEEGSVTLGVEHG